MKKLLLLLASLAVATACTKPQDTPKPEPKPEPSGEISINYSKIEKKAFDSVRLIIQNYDISKVEFLTTDVNFFMSIEADEAEGVKFIALTSFTAGEVTITVVCGDKKFPIECKFAPTVTEVLYKEPMNLAVFGKTLAEVTAMETGRGNEVVSSQLSEDGKLHWLQVKENTPVAAATTGELYEYIFLNTGTVDAPVLSPCDQANHYAIYGTSEEEGKKAQAACNHTIETYYLQGLDDDDNFHSLTRDLATCIQFYPAKFNPTSDYPNCHVFIAMYYPNTDKEQVVAVNSKNIQKSQLIKSNIPPYAKDAIQLIGR